jgi:hypothetical protein
MTNVVNSRPKGMNYRQPTLRDTTTFRSTKSCYSGGISSTSGAPTGTTDLIFVTSSHHLQWKYVSTTRKRLLQLDPNFKKISFFDRHCQNLRIFSYVNGF